MALYGCIKGEADMKSIHARKVVVTATTTHARTHAPKEEKKQ